MGEVLVVDVLKWRVLRFKMPKKRQPREIWGITRQEVLERDKHSCVRCHATLTSDVAHIDHIQSGKLGSNHISNLRALCHRCHALRADVRHNGMRAKAIKEGIIPPDWRECAWEG